MPQKNRKGTEANLQCRFHFLWPFVLVGLFGSLVRTVAIVWFRPLLVIVLRWWPRLFPVVCNDLCRVFRRPFVLISALCERSHRHHAEHRNQDYFSQ